MSTTAIIVELLVIGVQACVWISVLTALLALPEPLRPHLQAILVFITSKESGTLLAVGGIAVAYSVGVVADRIYDSIFEFAIEPMIKSMDKKIGQWVQRKRLRFFGRHSNEEGRRSQECRYRVIVQTGGALALIDYLRSRMRIARSTSVNLLMIAISLALFARRIDEPHRGTVAIAWISFFASIVAFVSWWLIFERYHRAAAKMDQMLKIYSAGKAQQIEPAIE